MLLVSTIAVVAAGVACSNEAPDESTAGQSILTYLNRGLDGRCPMYGDLEICSGVVPSFDGATLDVDITLPTEATRTGNNPLVIFLHGFGLNKHEWQSLTDDADLDYRYHWNSHWFAARGFYVINYTARGFRNDGPSASSQPATPFAKAGSVSAPNGTLHLKSREIEAMDTQWLAANVAAAFPGVDESHVVVTGGSYGGGEAWVLASEPEWTAPHAIDASLPVLSLRVAVPLYAWTDLGYSLAPHGHGGGPNGDDLYESSFGHPDSDTGEGFPFGVVKLSYTSGFYARGNERGLFASGATTTLTDEGPINIHAWYDRVVGAGDPYEVNGLEDPIVQQIRVGLTEYRSGYYQSGYAAQVGARKVAIVAVQGWTDDLFPALEAFRGFKYLRRLDPKWPVRVILADVGHARARDRWAAWAWANEQTWAWVQQHLHGAIDGAGNIVSRSSTCNDTDPVHVTSAPTPEKLAKGTLVITMDEGENLVSYQQGLITPEGGIVDPNGPATDPVISTGSRLCRVSPGPALGGYTGISDPLAGDRTYVGLGFARIPYTLTSGTEATLNVRLWSVAPDGVATYVSNGTYRLSVPAYDAAAGTVRVPFQGNHWRFPAGHRLRLDVTQVNNPVYRPAQKPSSITIGAPVLELPVAEPGNSGLHGRKLKQK